MDAVSKRIQLEQKIYEQVKRMYVMCRDIYDYAKVTGTLITIH
ncbi:hypothetical protein PA3_10660 [Acinetobacter pittii]|uniref:Uncharacterized protein n=1 Tax=Acinetobacter pittii TaxID=48296 RepID=A0A4Y3J7J5_ACIPI|nr:hypothetical protein [Acinetobacter pittii]GEA66908.1 hypothetical protein PA3_10660 [Acinetobacter pittii]